MKISKKLPQIILLILSLACFAFNAAAQQKERYLKPVDEAGKDVSFKTFRDKFLQAVRKRDQKYLLSVVDPKIKNGFGGMDGLANFKKQWKLSSQKSPLWDELEFILTHGGAFQREGKSNTFWVPYIYSNFPQDLDAFEYSAISDEGVKLHATPFVASPTVAALSYNIVKVDYQNSVKSKLNAEEYAWLKVETLGGKKGFVVEKFVRSPIGYRAAFEKKRGVWKMTALLAGD